MIGRLRSAIEAASFWNLHQIDSQALLSHEGCAISNARRLLFFHPRHMVRILTADPAALLELPLKFIVLELPEGGVTVRRADLLASFACYRNLELEELFTRTQRSLRRNSRGSAETALAAPPTG